jgi:oligoribonuclease (3'-5' exoribonuclease)
VEIPKQNDKYSQQVVKVSTLTKLAKHSNNPILAKYFKKSIHSKADSLAKYICLKGEGMKVSTDRSFQK